MDRSRLNEIYEKLDKRAHDICNRLHCSFGYYNGHYIKNERGEYEMDYFPIPVIEVKGVCDIELGLNIISITAKLTRAKAVEYDYEKIRKYNFEAYGVEDYLNDFFLAGDTIESMIEKIRKSNEENIFFSFYLPCDVDASAVCDLVNIITGEGFFY